jgi:hypothetical protein
LGSDDLQLLAYLVCNNEETLLLMIEEDSISKIKASQEVPNLVLSSQAFKQLLVNGVPVITMPMTWMILRLLI